MEQGLAWVVAAVFLKKLVACNFCNIRVYKHKGGLKLVARREDTQDKQY